MSQCLVDKVKRIFFDSFASFSQASSVIRFVIRTQKERIERGKNGTEYDKGEQRKAEEEEKEENG